MSPPLRLVAPVPTPLPAGPEAVEQQRAYAKQEQQYNDETLALKRLLRLRALVKLPEVSHHEMLVCCKRLRTAPLLVRYQMESLSVRVGHEYRYDETGWITIPHDWFLAT